MAETPGNPWVHIGECPVCVNGLCRVRTCGSDDQRHFFAMCDECETLWLSPSTNTTRTFPDATDPQCPVCAKPLYGAQSHWSYVEELKGTEWMENVILDFPGDIEQSSDGLVFDDDGPTSGSSNQVDLNSETIDYVVDDSTYGQDEPKPGC